jgi:hypothetical protein
MKKSTILSIILIGTFVSCKKSNSGPASYHMTANLDGTAKVFNFSPVASKSGSSGAAMIAVTGYVSASSLESFTLLIDNTASDKAIAAGTYTDITPGFNITCNYTLTGGGSGFEGGTSVTAMAANAGVAVKNHFKVVITSIDATSVKGTFSGDVYPNGDPSADAKTVTNGDFNVKFE